MIAFFFKFFANTFPICAFPSCFWLILIFIEVRFSYDPWKNMNEIFFWLDFFLSHPYDNYIVLCLRHGTDWYFKNINYFPKYFIKNVPHLFLIHSLPFIHPSLFIHQVLTEHLLMDLMLAQYWDELGHRKI